MNSRDLGALEKMPYFRKNVLRELSGDSENTLNESIKRFLAKGDLVVIKKGVYITRLFSTKYQGEREYLEFLSSVIRSPSYLSMEYVLSTHDVLTEGVLGFSAVTTKSGRGYMNELGSFTYKTMTKELFEGYEKKYFLNNSYFVASKAKALFDYLYYRRNLVDSTKADVNIAEDMRIRPQEFSKSDLSQVIKYARKSKSSKLIAIVENLYAYVSTKS